MSLTQFTQRRRAERLYHQISDAASTVTDRLYTTRSPRDRADLLDRLADHEEQLARLHTVTFGDDPNPDEGGRDVAESTGSSALLIRMLAETERQIAEPHPYAGALDSCLDSVGHTEAVLWRKLATVRDHADRADLISQIGDYAEGRVGWQATQSLACLARTERELADAALEHRAPVAPVVAKTPKRGRAVIVAAILTAAVAVELPDLLSLIH